MALAVNPGITSVTAWKVQGQETKPQQELLAAETLLTLSINGLKAYQLLYLPGLETELSYGFLLTSGIIEQKADVVEMRLTPGDQSAGRTYAQVQVRLAKTFDNKRDLSAMTAAAVLTGAPEAGHSLRAAQFRKFPDQQVQVTVAEILGYMASLPGRQDIFRQTGATHAIFLAAARSGDVVLGAEDVGRHNAFDKVIGQALTKNLPTGDKIALLSGRASFEMVFKAARAGIPIMSSVSAPTSLAVRLAELQGMTLIGFVREQRLNIYTHPHRVADLGIPK
jgi:FdhD protein